MSQSALKLSLFEMTPSAPILLLLIFDCSIFPLKKGLHTVVRMENN